MAAEHLRFDPPAVTTLPVAQPSEGGSIGRWELTSLLGEGALCRVHRARPTGSGAIRGNYAAKVLRGEWEARPEAVATIHREVEVTRRVRHPNLISVLDSRLKAPPYLLVMPCLEGQTLARLMAQSRPGAAEAIWYVRQVAQALDALDAEGWMHADVKPENIFIGRDGHATLLDLGFARQPGEVGSVLDRCVVGSVHHIAPEMIISSLRADIRSDIYGLGATLYELLAGRRPFPGINLATLARVHREEEPPKLRKLIPELPGELTRLVHRMLAKEPLRRPQTPRELVDELMPWEIELFGWRAGTQAVAC